MPITLIDELTTDMIYAIYGSASEFGPEGEPRQLSPKTIKPRWEGRAIYEMFNGVGTRIYPVAADIKRIGEDEVFASLADLPEAADVLILCLGKAHTSEAIDEAVAAGINCIWFQPGTNSPEALEKCKAKGIRVVDGCALRHRTVSGLTRFLSPCFYMGFKSPKLPIK